MRAKSLLIILAYVIISCSPVMSSGTNPNSSERTNIIIWAKQIANLQNRFEARINQAQPLIKKISDNPPTRTDISQLVTYNNDITSLYNELIEIEPPPEARAVHEQYMDLFTSTTDSVRYYVYSVMENDLSYFDKSVEAAKETNQISTKAHSSFESILNRYSISCEEIDFCE